ncbi:MAG: uroporphyrinogen decarboxylase family protein [Sphaerochaeta sp.]|nr:uroporphyrinogen decarboxylase family protein [Sphaerochaeta sp.]
MTHKERVSKALQHEITDRPPMQISFTPEFASRLAQSMGLTEEEHNPHGGGNTMALELALGQDVLLSSVGWANGYYGEQDAYTDEWGVGWRKSKYSTPFGDGHYTEITGHPLAEDSAIDHYISPDPNRESLYTDTVKLIKEYGDEYWITGVTVTTIFETAWALRGLDQLLMDFILDPDLAGRILDIPMQYHLQAAKHLVNLGVDMIWLGDDVGAQQNMIISPDMWRIFFKPRMAKIIRELKQLNPTLKIAYHSDGNIFPIIPDLIEIGLDVLNPIQPASMDPAEVKRLYGDKLCFWGSIDEQHTLPFGSPQDVADEVRLRLQTLGHNGGLIIGPTHHVQLDTPLENFFAMVDTIREGY